MTKVLCDRLDCQRCKIFTRYDDVGECQLGKVTIYKDGGCDEFKEEY